jgi:ATP-binding cassette subfamily B protein
MNVLIRLAKRTAIYKRQLLLAYLSIIGVTVFGLIIPKLIGTAIDAVIISGSSKGLWLLAGGIILANLFRGLMAYGQTFFGESLGQQVAYDLRNEFYTHLQTLNFDFHDKHQTGNLMSRATADIEGIRMFVQGGMIRSFFCISLIIGVMILIVLLDWRLSLYCLAFVPFIIWRGSKFILAQREKWFHVQVEMGHMTTILQENLSGQKVVKAFGAEEFEEKRFLNRTGKVAKYAYEAAALQANNAGMMTFFYMASTALILWVGGTEVINGNMTAGELAQFILYLGMLAMPVRIAAWVTNSFSRGLSAGTRIFEILDSDPSISNHLNADSLTKIKGEIKFENVCFSHESGKNILENINFRINPGETLGIIGPPGSGKTSIINLIPRFYEPSSGKVTIDDISVDEFEMTNLRKNIGLIHQDVFLFTDSIRENIAYGNPNVPFEEIEKVAKIAQIHDFIITLPQQYDTVVGERGSTLSGGQRQRISIARALLINPPILIIDDATSSVDTITEKYIQAQLEKISTDKTTIIIAHRISSVQNADNIIVLNNGLIEQKGHHNELIKQEGMYKNLYNLQIADNESGKSFNNENPPLKGQIHNA